MQKKYQLAGMVGLLVMIMVVFTGAWFPNETSGNTPVVDESEIVAEAIRLLAKGDPKAEAVDVKLLPHVDAFEAFGASLMYEIPDGYEDTDVFQDLPAKDDPVWVVAISSDNVMHLPMFAQGPEEYHGFIALFDADNGEMLSIRSVIDFEEDRVLKQIRQLKSLAPTRP